MKLNLLKEQQQNNKRDLTINKELNSNEKITKEIAPKGKSDKNITNKFESNFPEEANTSPETPHKKNNCQKKAGNILKEKQHLLKYIIKKIIDLKKTEIYYKKTKRKINYI